MFKPLRATLVAFAGAALCSAVAAGQTATATKLEWKFEKNKVRTEITRNTTTMSMDMMGQTMETSTDQTMWTVVKIVDVKDGVATIERVIKRMKVKMNTPQTGEFEWDSDSKEEPEGMGAMMVGQFKQMVGSKTTTRMQADGKVLETKGAAAAAGGADMAKLSPIFPSDLKVGSEIKTETSQAQGPVTVKISAVYTYKGKLKGKDKFDVETKMDYQAGPNAPMEIKVGKQSSEGYYLFDNTTGWTAGTKTRMAMNLDIKAPQGAMKQDLEVKSTSLVVDGEDTKTLPDAKGEKKDDKKDEKKSDF